MATVLITYELWFVNESGRSGTACVYLDASGVTTNEGSPTLLAWMAQPAHSGVAVRFSWQLDYWFLWSQPSPMQIGRCGPVGLGSRVSLSSDQFGLWLGTSTTDASGALTIQQDASIPAGVGGVAGIGLHGAGTYGLPIGPNLNSQFTPIAAPPYRIAFGTFSADVDQPIDPGSFPSSPASVTFPSNITTMTATIDSQNAWSVEEGSPLSAPGPKGRPIVVYEAGKGLVGVM